jgi:serine/threonine protein kinase
MRKLMLAGNQLQALPNELGACLQLELLRISANALPELPPMLLALPKLTWLAYAGNPFCDQLEASTLAASPHTHIPPVDWHQLTTEQVLGEGASGTIYQAQMQCPAGGQAQAVAVKRFKGDITSDGLPRHEMAASLNAGQHPQLIPVLGKVAGHPEGQSGMVLPLISPNCRNLAGPPSLDSCTRDVYAEGARFGTATVMHIAQGVASAAAHLHARCLMHGDLYAHNILYDDAGQVFLGDFGAASFLSLQDKQQAMALQRMEVRAFGCLLQELLEHCTVRPEQDRRLQTLADLRDACLHHMPGQRPLFAAIEQVFVGLGRC